MDSGPQRKRVRLSHACNFCRARKVRCDEQLPSCHNCEVAGVECVTVDPKRPEAEVPRKRVGHDHTNDPTHGPGFGQDININSNTFSSPTRGALPQPQVSNVEPRSNGDYGGDIIQRLQLLEQEIQKLKGNGAGIFPTPKSTRTTATTVDQPRDGSYGCPPIRPQWSIHPEPVLPSPNVAFRQVPVHSELQPLSTSSPEEAHLALDTKKRKWMGSSSVQVLTQWLDFYSTVRGSGQPLSASFRFGMTHAEEVSLPLTVQLPRLPPVDERNGYINAYLSNIHPLFPIFDIEEFWIQINRFSWLGEDLEDPPNAVEGMIPSSDRPILACIYAAISIGIDEQNGMSTELGSKYLDASYSLYAHLLARPYLNSIQAILLIVIALRLRCKDGAGWNNLSQAIRIAYSLGLHRERSSTSETISQSERILEMRIWWSGFCLESMMSFESGRPCMIDLKECSQILPTPLNVNSHVDSPDLFGALIRLARIQNKVSRRLFTASLGNKGQEEVMLHAGELDRELLAWADSLPVDIRPGQEIFCDPSIYSFSVFLALQYHQTLIMVHRASLLLDTKIFQSQVDLHCSNLQWKQRLRSGEAICAGAGRHIVKLFGGDGPRRVAGDLTPPLLAIYVLAIYLLKHPEDWSAKADLEQLTGAAAYLEKRYIEMGQSQGFVQMLGDLVKLVTRRVKDFYTTPVSSQAADGVDNDGFGDGLGMRLESISMLTAPNEEVSESRNPPLLDHHVGDLMDDLWPRVMGENLELAAMFDNEMYESALPYHLFGLPP